MDLDCPDFLEYLADDAETKIIALYIEGTFSGERLRAEMGKASNKKPVLALKGGVTEQGGRAVYSHTGSLAGSAEIWSSLFKQSGVIQVDDYDELLDIAQALTCSPIPVGKGVSMITNSGGFSVTTTDLIVNAGFEVPQFQERTMVELRKIVPPAGTSIRNISRCVI